MTSFRRLLEPPDLGKARQALESVFVVPDTAEPQFGPNAVARGIFQPVDRDLDLDICRAVAAAVGDSLLPAFATELGRWDDVPFEMRHHWLVNDICEPDLYDQLDASGWHHLGESALYDPEGAWGLMVSDEWYAIAAGDAAFVARLEAHLPPGVAWGIDSVREAHSPPYRGYDLKWIDRLESAMTQFTR